MVGGPPPPTPKDAHGAYAQARSGALGGEAVEKEALLRAARLLDDARQAPDDKAVLAKALKFNMALWTLFQADLAGDANRLPSDVKRDLLNLSLFMDNATHALTQAFDAKTLLAMIQVNRNLAGLG